MSPSQPVPIAVVGMGCRYPGKANSPEALWKLVAEGRHAYSDVPPDRFNHKAFYHPDTEGRGTTNQKGGHFLDQDIAAFDAGFFGMPPREAEHVDPQQRIVLEAAWEAAENAGIPMKDFKGSDTAVFVAMFGHDYEQVMMKDPLCFTKYHGTGTSRTLLANRVSYIFDLHGPSVTLDTGCSGSLVAVNAACQSLRAGETGMALAGGVGLIFNPDQMLMMSPVGIFNGEGRSFSFDDRGSGYGRGEGVGIVALKRLDDAIRDGDNIRAIIRNSGANQDGRTNGITLPNQYAQEALARKLFQDVEFSPSDVQYVEAHGTGTKVGDVLELTAISNVFCEGRDPAKPLFVGTSKPNIGHSEAASGSAGLIKTIIAMEKGFIPPNILLDNIKPGLKPLLGPIKIAQKLEPWPETTGTRKAIANSFGSGGTNAMVVLESADNIQSRTPNGANGHINGVNGTAKPSQPPRLFTFSARSEHSLAGQMQDLKGYLQQNGSVGVDDLSYTLTSKRSHFPWRSSVVTPDVASLISSLDAKENAPVKTTSSHSTVFVFTGQGAQYFQMGHDLVATETAFSQSIHRADQLLKDLGATWSLVQELSKDEASSRLNDSKFGQPASMAVQLALVDLLRSWGVQPSAVIGHSSGEVAAGYAAGAITQATAIRVAYERSFLSDAAKQRNSHPGAMMAVGLGEEDVQGYINKLALPGMQVVAACINSPSSTTVSGDAPAVVKLEEALKEEGIFARRLKIDTAYHSHHMKTVGGDYLGRLDGLESGSVDGSVRYFSTVIGKEKHEGFGASYWVDNLVSPVRFSDALDALVRALGGQLHMIEIGPHKALAGPIRQCLANPPVEGVSYKYIATLVRGEDSRAALLETGSSLYKAGLDLDMSAVASLGLGISRSPSPRTLQNLPPYHWDHTKIHWAEPRLSKDYRFRPHANHDLLGLRVLTSPDSEPTWRIILSLDTLPWLKDHVVDKFIVFPGSGYLAMAIEGLKQQAHGNQPNAVVTGYRLKNISFKRTLAIPDDSTGVEAVMTFRHSDTTGYNFRVFSLVDGKWQDHCDGHVSQTLKAEVDEVEEGRVAASEEAAKVQKLNEARESCDQVIDHAAFYAELESTGNKYGPSFAAVGKAHLGKSQALSNVIVPDIASTMPGRFMSPHTIHPSTLDATLHAVVTAFQRHDVSSEGSMMPVFMADTFVSADIVNQPGEQLEVLCSLHTTYASSSNFDIVAFQSRASGEPPKPVLAITNGELRVVGSSDDSASRSSQAASAGNLFKIEWGLDISSVTPADLEAVEIPLQSSVPPVEKVALMHAAATRYFSWAAQEITERGLTVVDDYRKLLWAYMASHLQSDEAQALLRTVPSSKDELAKQLTKIGVEGELLERLGTRLTSIITGTTDPLSLFLGDSLLYRVYDGDEIGRGNHYMAEYVRRLTFQNSGLRILELGAGTAGATVPLLQFCSPDGEAFASEYMYTDISSGFFDNVKQTKLKKWEHMMTFKTLDLEQDPVSQGFDEHGYDLILASNVVHATKWLGQSLGHIHRLLRPGGKFGMVEVIKTTPFHNMTFGLLPGWWAGAEDGRTSGPLQSIEQWNQRLVDASFSGVDLAAYDFPEPARHCSFILSTCLADPKSKPNGVSSHPARPIEFLNALPEGHKGHALGARLRDDLGSKGFQSVLREWSQKEVDETASYLILDSASHPLLVNASPEQFDHVIALLTKATKLYWITLSDGEDSAPEGGLVTGLSRTARSEMDNLKFFTINVQDSLSDHADNILCTLSKLIASGEGTSAEDDQALRIEYEHTLKDGRLYIQRAAPDEKLSKVLSAGSEDTDGEQCLFHQADRPLKVRVEKPGLLSSLRFVDDEAPAGELGPDDVEVQMMACGVNFKDQFVALGQMKPTQTMVGEGAGVLTRVGSNFASQYQPGQRVAVVTGTPYASRSVTKGHFIHPIPDSLSFADAASVPVAFTTASYGLVDCASLSKGQTVLIHAASGGLGQAAVMIAQHVGAVIFATVGSQAKKQLLVDKYGIPESHIFSSRTTSFQAGIMHLTRGEGVDVVLNSLSGDALRATWECVASMGTFVEVGKTDIYKRGQLDMEPFDRNVRFASVDLIVLSRYRPKHMQDLLKRTFAHIEAGHFAPLPVTPMPIGNIEQAFRLIQARKHTGKIVLEADPEATVKARVRPLRLRPDGTYVIFGGLGSLGKHLCSHLQARGARHIALVSRRSLDDKAKAAMQAELAVHPEASVRIVTCDITVPSDVSRALSGLQAVFPPVRGVFQAAMVLADHTLPQMNLEDFQKALRPKYLGTRNVAEGLAASGQDPDFFITLSSISGIIGFRGQANYAAANVFQDMFAQSRASASRGGFVSLNLPLVEESDAMSEERKGPIARQGCQCVAFGAVAALVDYAMGRAAADGNSQVALGIGARSMLTRAENNVRMSPLLGLLHARGRQQQQQSALGTARDTARRSVEEAVAQAATPAEAARLVLDAVRDKVASLIAADPAELGLDRPVAELGLDSLVAIELKNWVTRSLKAKVQTSDIMDAPSLTAFSALLVQKSRLLVHEEVKTEAADANGVNGSMY